MWDIIVYIILWLLIGIIIGWLMSLNIGILLILGVVAIVLTMILANLPSITARRYELRETGKEIMTYKTALVSDLGNLLVFIGGLVLGFLKNKKIIFEK
jgi:hypothetical protein